MKIFLECLPCLLRQALDAAKKASDDPIIHGETLDEALSLLQNYRDFRNSPDLTRHIHEIVKRKTGNNDPYAKNKADDLKAAQKLYPFLRESLERNGNDLTYALKIAAVGNVLDSAIYSDLDVEACIRKEIDHPFAHCDEDAIKKRLAKAKTVLVIGDNAGEAIFDRLLIERLQASAKIYYAVRGEPIINDVTMEEALCAELDRVAQLISTESKIPGTIVSECSPTFQKLFWEADVVISKGQGNYETLSDEAREIFFLLKAKCPMIAKSLGVPLGGYVLKRNNE